MKKIIALLLMGTIILSGCVQREILDDLSLEMAAAYDYVDNQVRGTALAPLYMPDKSVQNKTYSSSSNLSRDFLRDVQRQAPDPIVTGSLEVILFGEQLAQKKGILDIVDAFQRDPSVGAGLYLAVTEGEAKKIIKGNYGTRGTAIFISNLIRHNMKTKDVPRTNLQLFLSDFYQKGKSPYLPRLRKLAKDQIEISGISFFNYGRVVDSIPAEKMFYFKLLVDKYSNGTLKVNLGKERAAIESIRSKYKLRLVSRNPYSINAKIQVNAVLIEYSGARVTTKEIDAIEKKLKEEIEKECTRLIKRFRDKAIDPVGFGHFTKSKTRNFNFKKWKDDYKNLNVKVQADVRIIQSGVIE